MLPVLPLPDDLPEDGVAVANALLTRRSVRGFLPTLIPRKTVEGILYLASRTPSGTNIQPWKVYACTGAVRVRAERDDRRPRIRSTHLPAGRLHDLSRGVVRRHLSIPEDEMLLCGMSLGHLDPQAPENALKAERVPVDQFAAFHGW